MTLRILDANAKQLLVTGSGPQLMAALLTNVLVEFQLRTIYFQSMTIGVTDDTPDALRASVINDLSLDTSWNQQTVNYPSLHFDLPPPPTFTANVSAIIANISGSNVVVQAQTNFTPGVWGFKYGVNVDPIWWVDVMGTSGSQYIAVPVVDLDAISGDTINVQAGYSLTNPATDKVYVGPVFNLIVP